MFGTAISQNVTTNANSPRSPTASNYLFQHKFDSNVIYYSFMFDQNKSCDLLLHMNLEHQGDDEIRIKVSSASIDGEGAIVSVSTWTQLSSLRYANKNHFARRSPYYSDASLPNPHPTAAKNFRLLLSSGNITLQRLPFGQTSFTFSTQLTLGEVKKKGISSSSSIRATVLGR